MCLFTIKKIYFWRKGNNGWWQKVILYFNPKYSNHIPALVVCVLKTTLKLIVITYFVYNETCWNIVRNVVFFLCAKVNFYLQKYNKQTHKKHKIHIFQFYTHIWPFFVLKICKAKQSKNNFIFFWKVVLNKVNY